MADGSDFAHYLAARWPDLVGGLEDEGVAPDQARLAVARDAAGEPPARGRAGCARSTSTSACGPSCASAPACPRAPVRPRPTAYAASTRATRPSRGWRGRRRRGACAGAGPRASAWSGWSVRRCSSPGGPGGPARPAPREVRQEANALPVIWYAQGHLHLDDVVVELAGVDEFVAWGSGAAAVLRSGEVVAHRRRRRRARDRPGARGARPRAPTPPPYLPLGQYDVLVQSAPVPGGGWAHLLDSSRRDGVQDAVRQSESGRRALVVCTADFTCGEPRTIVEADGSDPPALSREGLRRARGPRCTRSSSNTSPRIRSSVLVGRSMNRKLTAWRAVLAVEELDHLGVTGDLAPVQLQLHGGRPPGPGRRHDVVAQHDLHAALAHVEGHAGHLHALDVHLDGAAHLGAHGSPALALRRRSDRADPPPRGFAAIDRDQLDGERAQLVVAAPDDLEPLAHRQGHPHAVTRPRHGDHDLAGRSSPPRS